MPRQEWTKAQLLQLSDGYWSACALHAAVRLGVFTALADGLSDAAALAERCGADARALAMLLDAVCALGLLDKDGDTFANTAFAKKYLVRESPDYTGHIILHHHHLMPSWARLHQAVLSGEPVRERVATDEEWRESFLMGMFNLAMDLAPKVVPLIDLAGRCRLLDLGGGPGTYAIHFCQHNPELMATIFDLPASRPFAQQTIARFGLADRIDFRGGDFLTDEIPGRYDVAWLSHILHGESPERCRALVAKAAAALEPGGMLLIQEFVLDDAKDGPLFPALFSLNMLLGTSGGQAYSEREIREMLSAAGVRDLHRVPLANPRGVGIIGGIV